MRRSISKFKSPLLIRVALFAVVLCFLCTKHSEGFTEPPIIPVSKPSDRDDWDGKTYYIDYLAPGGGDGSLNTPWNDIEDADGRVGAGNILKIKKGIYSATQWDESGTPSNPIVIEAFGDGDVYIEVSDNFSLYGNYIIIDGGQNRQITVRRKSADVKRLIRLMGDHQTIYRMVFQGPIGECDPTKGPTNTLIAPNAGEDVVGRPSNYRIYNNILDKHSHKGIYVSGTVDGEIRNNIIKNGEATAIQVNPHEGAPANGLVISGNMILNNDGECGGHGIYIQGDADRGGSISNVKIHNNIFSGNGRTGVHIAPNSNTIKDVVKIYNNVFYNNKDRGLSTDGATDYSLEYKNNIFLNDDVSIKSGVTVISANNLHSDPGFESTDYNDADFLKLKSSATSAINKGTNLFSQGVTSDYFGNARPQGNGYDIGAHEYPEGAPPLTGDVNRDGLINVQDVQACVNHILEIQDWGQAADVNGDESANVLDAQEIVNVILGE